MKRIGKRLTAGLAFAVASGFTLGGLITIAPTASADPLRDIADIEWEADGGVFSRGFSAVRLDADRVEAAHAGMPTPPLRFADGSPITGQPYYFFGKDPATGTYLPSSILLCIDMLHIDYEVPDGSEFFDLATLVPEETAVRISRTINAGLQLAVKSGLRISTDGSKPMGFVGEKPQDIMVAAQIMAWHLFARDNVSAPLPNLERSDFSVDKKVPVVGGGAVELIEHYDLTSYFAQIDELIDRYAVEPAFDTAPVRIGNVTVTLADPPALNGFELEVDPATSTPGYDAYLTVSTKADGSIALTRKRTIDRPLTLGFVKKFRHGLGADGLASGVRAANHQFKTVLSNVYTESFTVPIAPNDGGVIVRKSDSDGTALDGAEFTLYDATGLTVATDAWGRPLVGLTGADGHGRLTFADVPPGRYILRETRAPEGYSGDATPREVTVTPNGQVAANGGSPIVNTRLTGDLEIHKSNGVSVLQPGELTTYEIAIANRSTYTDPVDAVIEDVLPDGLRFVSADHGGVYDSDTRVVSWNVGPVDGTPIVVSVTARVEESVAPGTTIANRAVVTLDGVCPGRDDPAACEAVDADVVPALVLMKSNGTDVGAPGATSTYELTVVNTSEVDAPDVVIVDALPDGLVFVAADSHGLYAPDDHEVTWRLGTLGAGEQRTVRVVAWVDDELAPGTEITNIASVSSAGGCSDHEAVADDPAAPDDAPRANCAVEDVDRVPAVTVTKDDGVATVAEGQRLDYRIVATNTSDVAAPDVVVVDQLPYNVDFVEASLPLADVSTASVLHWDLGDLAAGESREITVSVTVREHLAPGTAVVNTATISSAGVCVDDPMTEAEECTGVDQDVVREPAPEPETPTTPVDEEEPGTPTTPVDEEEPGTPTTPADPVDPPAAVDLREEPVTGVTNAASRQLAQTGANLHVAVKIGALAVVLLITAGANALALRKRRGRNSA